MSSNIEGIGWCQNLAHSDYLHTISETCNEPLTLQERLHELYLEARLSGGMDKLDAKIEALRNEAANRAFDIIVSDSGPLIEEETD